MIIAKKKKNENIAEYILYMWQIEDLIRAYNLNIKGLDKGIYLLKILYTDNTNIIKRIWVK